MNRLNSFFSIVACKMHKFNQSKTEDKYVVKQDDNSLYIHSCPATPSQSKLSLAGGKWLYIINIRQGRYATHT